VVYVAGGVLFELVGVHKLNWRRCFNWILDGVK